MRNLQNLTPAAKFLKAVVLILTLCFGSERIHAQDTAKVAIEIDPRQYVALVYNKYRAREIYDTIWNWEKRKNVPAQKRFTLDNAGQIKILFDKEGLIKNTQFFGNISVEAEISGSSGTRQIEVNPYYEVGQARQAIGINSESPSELSNKLLSMLLELSDVRDLTANLKLYGWYTMQGRKALQNYGSLIDKLSDSLNSMTPPILVKWQKQLVSAYRDVFRTLGDYHNSDSLIKVIKTSTVSNFSDVLSSIKEEDYNNMVQTWKGNFVKYYREAAIYLQQKIPLIQTYLKSFDDGGTDELQAYLSLAGTDLIKYQDITSRLKSDKDTLMKLTPTILNQNDLNSPVDSVLIIYTEPILNAINSLSNLFNFRGSEIQAILVNYAKQTAVINNYNKDSLNSLVENGYSRESLRNLLLNIINDNRDTLSSLIAEKAGRLIYRKLILASIDLAKSGAAEGESISLYITWSIGKKDSVVKPPRLELGKYNIAPGGWVVQISDIFSLVNRINPGGSIDQSHESPSVFKGAGGAALMWSYQKEDKGLNITRSINGKDTSYSASRKNVLMNFLQPSFGINVSYLDFNTTKDVEVGVGLQMGLFGNKVYFGYGMDLTLSAPKDAPYYFFLGFSFAKLSDLFKGANKISSSP